MKTLAGSTFGGAWLAATLKGVPHQKGVGAPMAIDQSKAVRERPVDADAVYVCPSGDEILEGTQPLGPLAPGPEASPMQTVIGDVEET